MEACDCKHTWISLNRIARKPVFWEQIDFATSPYGSGQQQQKETQTVSSLIVLSCWGPFLAGLDCNWSVTPHQWFFSKAQMSRLDICTGLEWKSDEYDTGADRRLSNGLGYKTCNRKEIMFDFVIVLLFFKFLRKLPMSNPMLTIISELYALWFYSIAQITANVWNIRPLQSIFLCLFFVLNLDYCVLKWDYYVLNLDYYVLNLDYCVLKWDFSVLISGIFTDIHKN